MGDTSSTTTPELIRRILMGILHTPTMNSVNWWSTVTRYMHTKIKIYVKYVIN